jgi:hypothetical protein
MVNPMTKSPFKVGEFVIYRPSAVGGDKSVMTDLGDSRPGARYKIVRMDEEAYVVVEGHEASPAGGGGLYWSEFERAP